MMMSGSGALRTALGENEVREHERQSETKDEASRSSPRNPAPRRRARGERLVEELPGDLVLASIPFPSV